MERRDHYATASEIAAMMGWSVAYVRKRASLERWRRLGTRPQRYHLGDTAKRGVDRFDNEGHTRCLE